jgi:hypothetical protein
MKYTYTYFSTIYINFPDIRQIYLVNLSIITKNILKPFLETNNSIIKLIQIIARDIESTYTGFRLLKGLYRASFNTL